ncbi:(deoxy)nucleoside triphosphate pyrophosphohydrolase [Dactylosporangium sp. NPDC051485]|uniref:(deoxy)nucleoside triphosphate pyrophosphohydrolase n=1 Tax=Dactylosporangium sp. NPDC051485 TaxID=3154846 RepID=UPI0034415D1F
MPRIIVGAAIISEGRVLACERAAPPEMAGRWEFPGGKVDPGETEEQALVRECQEELGVDVVVGPRVGDDIEMLGGTALLRVYVATLANGGQPIALEHSDLRWLGAGELHSVPWLPADAPIVYALEPLLPSSP